MNNTTATIDINTNFTLLRAALQQAIDDMDTLAYAQDKVGMYQIPAYVVNHVEAEPDQIGLIDKTEKDLYAALDAVDDLAPVVLEKLINQKTEEQLDHQTQPKPVFEEVIGRTTDGPAKEWTAKVYLFDSAIEEFDDSKFFCKMAQRQSENLGIKFDKGEMMFRVVFWSPEDEDKDKSWQDHQLPLDLQQALGLDMEEAHFASGFLPYSIISKLNRSDAVIWEAKPGVRIRLVKSEKQGAHLDGTFEDTLNSLLAYHKQQQEQAEA